MPWKMLNVNGKCNVVKWFVLSQITACFQTSSACAKTKANDMLNMFLGENLNHVSFRKLITMIQMKHVIKYILLKGLRLYDKDKNRCMWRIWILKMRHMKLPSHHSDVQKAICWCEL